MSTTMWIVLGVTVLFGSMQAYVMVHEYRNSKPDKDDE